MILAASARPVRGVPRPAVLREGGRLVLQVAECFELKADGAAKSKRKRSAVYLPVLAKVISFVESLDLDFAYRETKVWLKFIRPARAPFGSLGSPSDPKSYNSHEWIIVWSLGSHQLQPPTPDSPTGMTKDSDLTRSVSRLARTSRETSAGSQIRGSRSSPR